MKTIAVIPARYQSSRLPGKPLIKINGKTMIQIVWENAISAKNLDSVIIATDHELIFNEATRFGAIVKMTSVNCNNGTERVIEAIQGIDCDTVLNIQCDEPLIDSTIFDDILMDHFQHKAPITTGCVRINDEHNIQDPNCVKVVLDRAGYALYFSRAPIPFIRNSSCTIVYAHLGVYAYNRSFLHNVKDMEKTMLSETESLEQLKFMEYGYRIKIKEVFPRNDLKSVDTPNDLAFVRKYFEEKSYE